MTASQGAGHGKIADIELLRGIAVIFVLVEHTRINLFPWIWGPEVRLYFYFGFWSGVDLFFAISGFVITRSLLPMLEMTSSTTGFFNAALSFWVRRIWRLLPSAWLWLAVILVSAAVFNRSGVFWSFRANFEGVIAALLDVANFRIAITYAKAETGCPPFPCTSLSLEEQFYILLPIVIFFARRRLPWVLAAGILAQFFLVRSGRHAGDFGMLANALRSDALMLGVLLAIWSRSPTYRLFEPTGLKGRAPAGLALLALFTPAVNLAVVGWAEFTIVPFQRRTGGVALGRAGLRRLLRPGLSDAAGTGEAGHAMGRQPILPLYLIHIPAFFLAREIWFRIEPPGTVLDRRFALPRSQR